MEDFIEQQLPFVRPDPLPAAEKLRDVLAAGAGITVVRDAGSGAFEVADVRRSTR